MNIKMKRASKGVQKGASAIFSERHRIKMKLPAYYEGDVQLTKRQYVHATTAVNTAAINVTSTTATSMTTCKAKNIEMNLSRIHLSIVLDLNGPCPEAKPTCIT